MDNSIRLGHDNFCPVCKHTIDAVSSMDGEVHHPVEGDVSICSECTAFLVFDENQQSQVLTPEELLTLPDEILNMLADIRHKIYSYQQIKGEKSGK